ncbi:MAG: hypothetical protein LKKZDAJK_000873 [Candidatus Fervidibacter sp.]
MMGRLFGGVVLVGFFALCLGCGGGGGPVSGPSSGQETVSCELSYGVVKSALIP